MAGGGAVADGAARVRATPLAKRVAATHGIDVSAIQGSGPAGRIQKADVDKALHAPSRASQRGAVQPPSTQTIRGVRKIIAERVYATHNEVPPVTLTHPVGMDGLQALRSEVNHYIGYKTSLNSWLSYAAVRALYRVPALNCTYPSGEITLHDHVHLGIAVDSKNGLLIPKIESANRMAFLDFDRQASRMIANARDGAVQMDDLQGATFTVTNLGMYGITHFTPIIPLPQVAILGLSATREVLTRHNGQIAATREMNLLLTVDHRVIDGALAARYLSALAEVISSPAQLLI